jgi:hypothetical protein
LLCADEIGSEEQRMTPWASVHNVFDPFRPVPPEKVDSWFVERPASPLDVLLAELDPGILPRRSILVGQLASGKSSELAKLASELRHHYGYFVVRISLEENLDIDKANPVEIVFLLGAAIYKVAHAELADKPDQSHLEGLSAGLETIVRTHTANREFRLNLADVLTNLVCYGATLIGGVVGAAAGTVAKKLISPLRFVSGTDQSVVRKLEVEPQIEQMVERLNLLIADVEQRAGRPLTLIVDGLDKIRDPDLIALNFADKKFLADPACRVVYAAPIDVYYATRFAGVRSRFPVHAFPNIKLRTQDLPPRRVEDGYAVMREVVRRRVESLGLSLEDVIEPPALDTLIDATGGVIRDLVRLMQDATTDAMIHGKTVIDRDTVAAVVLTLRRLYAVQLTPRYRAVLDRVRATHGRTDDDECDELLRANLVLSYPNEREVWFDVHAILDWVRERNAG